MRPKRLTNPAPLICLTATQIPTPAVGVPGVSGRRAQPIASEELAIVIDSATRRRLVMEPSSVRCVMLVYLHEEVNDIGYIIHKFCGHANYNVYFNVFIKILIFQTIPKNIILSDN